MLDLLTEESIERFQLRGQLGFGSMGVVYRAWDHLLEREVALKIFHVDQALDIDDIRREVAVAQRLHHAGFVRVYDAVQYSGAPCISMEWVRGHSLRQQLEQKGALDVHEVIALGIEVADAVAFAHDNFIVHCDLKPDNILIDKGRFRLIDFGLALSLTDPIRHSESKGTQLYMSPEQRQGLPVDCSTDIFSIGVILFEAAVGRQLSLQELACGPEAIANDLRSLPIPLRRAIRKCLQVQPRYRYATAREIVLELQEPSGISHYVSSLFTRVTRGTLSRKMTSILVLGFLSIAAFYSATALMSDPKEILILPISAPKTLHINASALYDTLWSAAGSASVGRVAILPPGIGSAISTKWKTAPDMIISIQLLTTTSCRISVQRRWTTLLKLRYSRVVTSSDPALLSNRVLAAIITAGLKTVVQSQDTYIEKMEWNTIARATHNLRWHRDDLNTLREVITECDQAIARASRCGPCFLRKAEAETQIYLLTKDITHAASARADVNKALLLCTSRGAWIRGAKVFLQLHDRDSLNGVFKNSMYNILATQQGLALEGAASAEDGLFEVAIPILRKALERNPLDINTANNLALAEMSAGRYDEAIKSFERILVITPDSYAALNNVALAYMRAGAMDKAVQALERVLNRRPTAESFSNLGMALVYSRKSCVVALPYFEAGAKLAPQNEAVVGYLAHAYRWCGMKEQAEHTYRKAIDLARRLVDGSASSRVYMDLAVYAAALQESSRFEAYLDLAKQNSGSLDYDLQYEAAVGFALLDDKQRAADSLQLLARAGYSRTLLAGNPDFAPYRRIWEH
jgi:serine/threonine-protein kinase